MKPRSPESALLPRCRPPARRVLAGLALSLACSRGATPAEANVAPAQPSQSALRVHLVAPAAGAATSAEPTAPTDAPQIKLSAPAEVHLTTSGTSGQVQATLSMRATADIPRCVGRFVVPAGVTVTAGDREKDWGPVASGEQKQLQLTLLVPAQGTFVLAGGMDLYLSSGVRLHQGDAVQLGQ